MKRHRRLRACIVLLALLSLGSLAVFAQRTPREGEFIPRRGPLAGKVCRYGGVDFYSQVAEFTIPELLDFISGKKPPPRGSEVPVFLMAMKEKFWTFGSQLSREGFDRYTDLVKWCLEDGKFSEDKGTCRHKAPFPVGIDIHTGKPVSEYMADDASGRWLVRPGWIL